MESVDVANLVKKQRPNTLGDTAQAHTPTAEAIEKAKTETVQAQETAAAPEAPVISKGVSVGLDDTGKFIMNFVGNAPNYLELIALFDYAAAKKNEILEQLSGTGTYATRTHVINLTKNVSNLVEGMKSIVSEVENINKKLDTSTSVNAGN